MSKILVTGTTGLSRDFSAFLSKNGYECTNISIRDDSWRNNAFASFDAVVHIAGIVPKDGVEAKAFYSVNTEKTKALAQKAKAEGVRHFVYISTMAVYGVSQQTDIKAGTVTAGTPCKPDSDYGKSKLLAEQFLKESEDGNFAVGIIRVPSIYGQGKTEYIDQYKYLGNKLPFIPVCFNKLKKSAICAENLFELMRLIVENKSSGVFCPDDGAFSATEFCAAIFPKKKKSVAFGKIMEIFLGSNPRIKDYYGAVCYSPELSNCFEGKYRVFSLQEGINKAYEK